MDRLWAPWRENYVRRLKKERGCIFCRVKKGTRADYVIFKTRLSIVMLNIYPYNNGHLLVSPLRHIRDISQLSDDEMLDLFKCLDRAKKLLHKALKPQGYNIGLNLERFGGAGITGHLHLHIVPRWSGDSNFMPVISDTKIISQSLTQLVKHLKNADK
ncbi:HIT domain-containing protein [bacterium]|nr:MAG: HIT domain-containing protein [bacterium]